MKLIVFGATGGTGLELLSQGAAAGHTMTAFTRGPLETPHATVVRGDVFDVKQVADAIRGHDAVLSCLGTRPWRHVDICSGGIRAQIPAMTETGVKRIIVISSQGVGDSDGDMGFFGGMMASLALRKSFRDKGAMEKALEAPDAGLDWIVVRPGLLTNGKLRGTCRAADDRSLKAGSVGRADVAAFMLRQLTSAEWLRRKPVVIW